MAKINDKAMIQNAFAARMKKKPMGKPGFLSGKGSADSEGAGDKKSGKEEMDEKKNKKAQTDIETHIDTTRGRYDINNYVR